jgi:hypothetical protein
MARLASIVAVLLGIILMILLIVPLLGPCWHLLYGEEISYAGWKVPVPKGFYVRRSLEGPTMWKEGFGIPFVNASYGHISLFHRPSPFAFDRDYAQFKQALIEDAAKKGYELKAERTAQVGKSSAYCLDFTHSSKPRSLLRCAVENSGFTFFYEGDTRYLSDAISALQGMSENIRDTSSRS